MTDIKWLFWTFCDLDHSSRVFSKNEILVFINVFLLFIPATVQQHFHVYQNIVYKVIFHLVNVLFTKYFVLIIMIVIILFLK